MRAAGSQGSGGAGTSKSTGDASRVETITFGVEWELLVHPSNGPFGSLLEPLELGSDEDCPTGYPPNRVSSGRHPGLRHIAHLLRTNGIKALTSVEQEELRTSKSRRREFPDINFSLEVPERVRFRDYFVVKTDATLHCYDRSRPLSERWVAVEICTPILEFGKKESFDLLTAAVDLINANFQTMANETCGLHVHVGNGDAGFRLEWARVIAGLVWSASTIMDLLHPVTRGPARSHASGLRYFSNLAHRPDILDYERIYSTKPQYAFAPPYRAVYDDPQNFDPLTVMATTGFGASHGWVSDPWMDLCGAHHLLRQLTMDGLLGLLSSRPSGRRLAYNFNNLQQQKLKNSRTHRTIEFRQAAGTTSADAMCAWATVCCSIVRFARDGSAKNVRAVVGKAAKGAVLLGTYGPTEFMRDVGAAREAAWYETETDFDLKRVVGERYERVAAASETNTTRIKGLWKAIKNMFCAAESAEDANMRDIEE